MQQLLRSLERNMVRAFHCDTGIATKKTMHLGRSCKQESDVGSQFEFESCEAMCVADEHAHLNLYFLSISLSSYTGLWGSIIGFAKGPGRLYAA